MDLSTLKKIIVLKGTTDSGKTRSISYIPPILENFGFELYENKDSGSETFRVYKRNNLTIGIASQGDYAEFVNKNLEELVNHRSDIIITASKRYDRGNDGTHKAILKTNFNEIIFIDKRKTQFPEDEKSENLLYARRVVKYALFDYH
jgi:hypothetical protein